MMYCACYNYTHLEGCFNSFMMRCTSHSYTHLDGFFNSFVMCCTSHNYTHVDGFRVAVKGDSREANVLSTNGRVWQVERDEQSLDGQQLWNRKTSQGIKNQRLPLHISFSGSIKERSNSCKVRIIIISKKILKA